MNLCSYNNNNNKLRMIVSNFKLAIDFVVQMQEINERESRSILPRVCFYEQIENRFNRRTKKWFKTKQKT